jgi:uncharacterized protein (DUF697 family)
MSMANILKLPDLWRVIRELDLEQIRRDAEGRFRLVVLSEKAGDAVIVVSLLSGDRDHPWIETRTPSELSVDGDDRTTVTAVLALTDQPALTPAADSAIQRLARAGVPVVTLVHGGGRPVDAVARAGETGRVVVPALDEHALDPLAAALVRAVPAGLRLALARQLPPVRDAVFDLLLEETAKANATYAFTTAMAEAVPVLDVPLNLADILVLTKNQLLMGYKIALGAGKSGRARDVIGEVVGVVGGGFLFRQAARQLVGLIPMAGLIPKVAIAYTGTWAIGRAVVVWATQGRRVSPAALRRLSHDAAGRGRAFARGLLRSPSA